MTHTHSALAVANTFVEIAHMNGNSLTHVQIQKLVFMAHGWWLAITDRPLISEEIQAWQYGPVVKSLYHIFKKYGKEPISCKEEEVYLDKESMHLKVTIPTLTSEARELIELVYNKYGRLSGGELIAVTHQQKTPWDVTYNLNRHQIIPNELIQAYYKKLNSNAAV